MSRSDVYGYDLGRSPDPNPRLTLDELIVEANKYILPVDVTVGAGTVKAGCKVGTVLRMIKSHAEAKIATAFTECHGCISSQLCREVGCMRGTTTQNLKDAP